MTKTAGMFVFGLLIAALWVSGASAQTRPPDTTALRSTIERRFDVLPLREGLVLRPKSGSRSLRSIELTRGSIAVDGQPVTGAELRARLGDDADAVLQLSYLSEADRDALFGIAAPATPPSPPPPSAAPAPPVPPSPDIAPDRPRSSRRTRGRSSDMIRIGSGVTVTEGQVVDGDVVAVGGSAHVDGEVRGDVVAVGGNIELGPGAVVTDNVVVIGGRLERADSARIGGRVQEVGIRDINFGRFHWPAQSASSRNYWGSMFGSALALIGTLIRVAILCLLAALVILLAHPYAMRAGDRALRDPLRSGAIGFLAQVLFIPILVITVLVLVITIIGIPLLLLLPFAMLALALVGLVGFTGVAERVGQLCSARIGMRSDNPYATTSLGILVLLSPALLARVVGLVGALAFPMSFGLVLVAGIVEYLAWTIGFGALALTRFDRALRSES